jgi:hypothetical protein
MFAMEHPKVEWEPVAIAAAALNFKRDRNEARGVSTGPALPGVVVRCRQARQPPEEPFCCHGLEGSFKPPCRVLAPKCNR